MGADAAPAQATARSDLSSDTEEDAADSDEDEPEDPAMEAARHAAMLAEVRGSAGDRKRKRMVVASEAYPDSEHNLPPTSSAGGKLTQQSGNTRYHAVIFFLWS